jgi:hypothetical protein
MLGRISGNCSEVQPHCGFPTPLIPFAQALEEPPSGLAQETNPDPHIATLLNKRRCKQAALQACAGP